jgi:hypothetical protein
MTKEEELLHLETHAIHLCKVLQITNERIEDLTNTNGTSANGSSANEIFAKEKAAFKAGKRIAWRVDVECDWEIISRPNWDKCFQYKIVEDDIYYTGYYIVPGIYSSVKTKYTKCALTGKITAEVLQ